MDVLMIGLFCVALADTKGGVLNEMSCGIKDVAYILLGI